MLDMMLKDLERVLYFEAYVVLEPGMTSLQPQQLLTDDEYLKAQDEFGEDNFRAGIGAEAVKELLAQIDLPADLIATKEALKTTNSETKKKKIGQAFEIAASVQQLRHPPRVDGVGCVASLATGIASVGAFGWWSFRDLRSERFVSPCHQPEQPFASFDRAACAGHYRP